MHFFRVLLVKRRFAIEEGTRALGIYALCYATFSVAFQLTKVSTGQIKRKMKTGREACRALCIRLNRNNSHLLRHPSPLVELERIRCTIST